MYTHVPGEMAMLYLVSLDTTDIIGMQLEMMSCHVDQSNAFHTHLGPASKQRTFRMVTTKLQFTVNSSDFSLIAELWQAIPIGPEGPEVH